MKWLSLTAAVVVFASSTNLFAGNLGHGGDHYAFSGPSYGCDAPYQANLGGCCDPAPRSLHLWDDYCTQKCRQSLFHHFKGHGAQPSCCTPAAPSCGCGEFGGCDSCPTCAPSCGLPFGGFFRNLFSGHHGCGDSQGDCGCGGSLHQGCGCGYGDAMGASQMLDSYKQQPIPADAGAPVKDVPAPALNDDEPTELEQPMNDDETPAAPANDASPEGETEADADVSSQTSHERRPFPASLRLDSPDFEF